MNQVDRDPRLGITLVTDYPRKRGRQKMRAETHATIIVKGSPVAAMVAAARLGWRTVDAIPDGTASILRVKCSLSADQARGQLVRWFDADLGHGPPFAEGTLLWYRLQD
jgi:hypothetical protein